MLVLLEKTYYSSELNFELQIYQDSSGQYWFHAATLCNVLSLRNPTKVLKRSVDEDWREKFPVTHGKEVWFVKEPGLYQLAFASKSPSAKKFQRWVFEEVLPKLRADGYYVARKNAEAISRLEAELLKTKKALWDTDEELIDTAHRLDELMRDQPIIDKWEM